MHIISSELSGGAASVLLSSAGAGLDILLHNYNQKPRVRKYSTVLTLVRGEETVI